MGIKRTPWTEAYIAARIRKGRGRGEGPEYQPWITVQDFSSRGTQSRIPSALLGRAVHVMSYLERRMFLLHEFKLGLLDYREQYPIPQSTAVHIRRPEEPPALVRGTASWQCAEGRATPPGESAVHGLVRQPGVREVIHHAADCQPFPAGDFP